MNLVLGFILSILLVLVMRPIGTRLGLFDHPEGRKDHGRPVLVIGGIAMVLSFKLILPWLGPISDAQIYLMLALALICLAGLVDDLHHFSFRHLFLAQIMAGLLVTWGGGVQVHNLGNLFGFGAVHTGYLSILFTLICLLGVINAVNMLDGVDGLAGVMVSVSVTWFALLAYLSGKPGLYAMLLLLLGVIFGFLLFNLRSPWLKRASVFMGNAGSMSLGLLLTWFAVQLAGDFDSAVTPITAVWVIALPLMDMCRVMCSRIRQGKSPFVGDHLHMHHMLSSAGYSVGQVVVIKGLLSAVLGGAGVACWLLGVPEWVMFYAFAAVLVVYFYFSGPGWPKVCHFIEMRRYRKYQ